MFQLLDNERRGLITQSKWRTIAESDELNKIFADYLELAVHPRQMYSPVRLSDGTLPERDKEWAPKKKSYGLQDYYTGVPTEPNLGSEKMAGVFVQGLKAEADVMNNVPL